MFDYFYGVQAEQFAFYRIPKVLFTNDRFRVLSAEAKTLYGILLDRVSLSVKNGWIDPQGRVYIICTIDEIMADIYATLYRGAVPEQDYTLVLEARAKVAEMITAIQKDSSAVKNYL